MRTAILVLALVAFAGSAYATDPDAFRLEKKVDGTELTRDIFYCNGQPHVYVWTINASSGFGSELADDIPNDLYCHYISDVVFIIGMWGGNWVNPAGVTVNFYEGACPPGQDAMASYYIAYGDPVYMPPDEMVLWYDDPGWFTAWMIVVYICPPIHIGMDMSIGFQVDNVTGQNAPYCGVTTTDDYVWYGACEAYWDGTYWGVPRWTPISGYFGVAVDIYWCLSEGQGPSAGDVTTWGAVKSLYK